jgi:protein-tyrosine-phosphatase
VQSLRDPWPGLVDLARIAGRQWHRVTGVLRLRRRLAQERRAGQPGGAGRRALAGARKVLFLCYGNINRSALAQAAAAARHPGLRTYSSAGFHAPAGRAADAVMVETAAAEGVDLRGWQSHTLDAGMVDAADVILAMEVAHLDRLFEEHPSARGKAFLLGAATATGPGDTEVPDPYGKSPAVYRSTCRQVLACLDGWFGRPQGS